MRESSQAADGGRTGFPKTTPLWIPLRRELLAIGIAVFLLFTACATATVRMGGLIAKYAGGHDRPGIDQSEAALLTWPANSAELTVAVSPSMADTLQEQADTFNRRNLRTPDGQRMGIRLVEMSPQEMVERSLGQPEFQAVAPDSSLWLRRIDRRWAELFPQEQGSLPARRVGESTRFALSPIVIALREKLARQLGWPRQMIGWKELHLRATAGADFNWRHPGTDNSVGLLATLAAFHVGAGITNGLTPEIATRPDVVDYLRRVEATVQFEVAQDGTQAIDSRPPPIAEESNAVLDAIVTQEQAVIAWNQAIRHDDLPEEGPWVTIYPHEGTLWADHPLALLELDGRADPALTRNQRRTYRAFTDFLLNKESQFALLQAGYRPADLTIDLNDASGPFANNPAVDTLQPQNLLPMPSPPLMEVTLNIWRYTRRPANLFLVVDTSESMQGEKLTQTKAALRAFVDQIQGDRDRIGLVEVGSDVKHFGSLQPLDRDGRFQLSQAIGDMQAGGYTALLDAVLTAHTALQNDGDAEAINAIVVMTDGRDNDSLYRFRDLQMAVQDAQVPVVIHTVAFGRDADGALLQDLALISGGQFHRADRTNIGELYRFIATYLHMAER